MFNDFSGLDLFPVTGYEVFINLCIALACGLIISYVYRITYKGPSYSITLVNSLVLLTIITSIVLLVIGNNLARAFGLVGAMSIIRFRTAVRDVQDIIFIFLALAIGMASGVGLKMIAFLGTMFVSIVIIALTTINWAHPRKREYLLQISYNSSDDNELTMNQVLKKYCKNLKLVNLKNIGYADEIEAYYHIMMKDTQQSESMVKELNNLDDVFNINLYFDEDDSNAPT
ncbi:MAG: DUF4956 domain-containing protein [Bacteroidota bacterium]|nr:DUF4956 domain-containing protein [Bacteroidota bacterium]